MILSIAPTTKMLSTAAKREIQQALDFRLQGKMELLVFLKKKKGMQEEIELLVTLEGNQGWRVQIVTCPMLDFLLRNNKL